jgi:hypothetical protein
MRVTLLEQLKPARTHPISGDALAAFSDRNAPAL